MLTVAAVLEVATGVALLILPSLIGRLLFGEELTGIVIAVARVLGIALLALGVGCWPGSTALCGMLTYSALVTLYFLYIAIRGEWEGFCSGRRLCYMLRHSRVLPRNWHLLTADEKRWLHRNEHVEHNSP